MSEVLSIARLGGKGEGIADRSGGPVFLPYALPGERIEAEIAGDRGFIAAILEPSLHRVTPPCPYFTRCGGCAIQHLAAPEYGAWKRGLLVHALERARLETVIAPLVDARGTGRRRVTLHVRYTGTGKAMRAEAGFMAVRSHTLIDLDHCPILVPALASSPTIARAVGEALKSRGKPLDVQLTATLSGLDVDIRGAGTVGNAERLSLSELAHRFDLARLTVHGELIVSSRAPLIAMGRAQVIPPPGSFLQATEAGEAALAELVTAAAGGAKRVADLFCGSGPFALRLAERSSVTAMDNGEASIQALKQGASRTQGLKPITASTRDLFRRPLLAKELSAFDAIVFDPPRAGAEAQARQIAQAKVAKVIAVSCDTGTFARDARILVEGGYRLESITPVDQFVYSAHLETVAVFSR